MNLNVSVSGEKEVAAMLESIPGKAHRAAAVALNKAGKEVKGSVVNEMLTVFDRPTRFTINSLQLTPATKDNLNAVVWFKTPDRMGQHYLVPQVDGGQRRLKGFEQAIDLGELVPAAGAKIDQYGNVSIGQIRQLLSVLGRAEAAAGYMANITDRSRRRNTRQRDYVVIDGRQKGHLPQGVYQRFQTGSGFGAKTKRTILDRSKAYQKGSRKIAVRDPRTGRIVRWESTASRIQSIVRARGLRPVLLMGRTGHQVKPLLDFYGVAGIVFNKRFEPLFWETMSSFLGS